jgi:hypothetical protein
MNEESTTSVYDAYVFPSITLHILANRTLRRCDTTQHTDRHVLHSSRTALSQFCCLPGLDYSYQHMIRMLRIVFRTPCHMLHCVPTSSHMLRCVLTSRHMMSSISSPHVTSCVMFLRHVTFCVVFRTSRQKLCCSYVMSQVALCYVHHIICCDIFRTSYHILVMFLRHVTCCVVFRTSCHMCVDFPFHVTSCLLFRASCHMLHCLQT